MKDSPRVRFAPSPTGELHVGNARTALFNWMFARRYGGEFILRIEDTDRVRTSESFERGIIRDLRWLSIDWDEGPEKQGGCGPYHQYQRLDIYRKYLRDLIEADRVYPCYCTEEELEVERAALLAKGQAPRYLGRCRNLSNEERMRLEREGSRPAYRFRVGEEQVCFDDMIRGAMKFDSRAIGDFIIVRSNEIPAYNFAVVIDDHLMKISHVIRGEDHLSNTAIQLLLYAALGFEPPRFAHHSLILGKDRSKLSKRHGAVAVKEFREKGILPEALLNYLSLLGSSQADGKEIATKEEIVAGFTLDRAGKSGAIFDEGKLKWLNGIYIRNCPTEELTERLLPFIRQSGYDDRKIAMSQLYAIVDAVKGNLSTLSDIGRELAPFSDSSFRISEEAAQIIASDRSRAVLNAFYEALRNADPATEAYAAALEKACKETGMKGKALFMPLRAALTGVLKGPELDRIYHILGRDTVLDRLRRTTAKPGTAGRI